MVGKTTHSNLLNANVTGWQLAPKSWRFLLIIILVISIFFRFTNLERKVFWFDETASIFKISGYTSEVWWDNKLPNNQLISVENLPKYYLPNPESNVIDTIKFLAQEDSKHVPLYFVILRLWVDWFGNSVVVMRSLSAVISLLTFPCIYWLCLELFQSSLIGWIGVALIAVSPFHLLYAQEARMYSLQMVMILLSSAIFLRAIRINNKLNWGLYASSLSLSIYTHTLCFYLAIAHGIYVFAAYGIRQSKVLINYLVATLIALCTFVPWLFFIITHAEKVAGSMDWATQPMPLFVLMRHWAIDLSRIFIDFYPSNNLSEFSNSLSIFCMTITFILVGYLIYYICLHAPRKTWIFILSLIGIPFLSLALPDILLGGIRSYNSRYLIASYLGIHLAVAYLMTTKIILSSPMWRQKLWQIVTLTLIGCGISSCIIISPAETWWNKYYASENLPVAKIVNQSEQPLLLIENYWWSEGNLYSMSHFLKPKVKIQALTEGKMISKIPDNFHNVFLFNPSETLQKNIKKSQNYQIKPVYNGKRFLLWKLEK
ncbi:hypothetical protein NIES4101_45040 [Calothrix sp. NIES-4101]|nr:hypothetical protein NIES4101_45040 [Calothrix sp. NIES-4101]